MTSGRLDRRAASNDARSRRSARWSAWSTAATPAASKLLGSVGGSSAYPVTCAPSASSHSDSHEPLNQVWPVTKTDRPAKAERTVSSTDEDPGAWFGVSRG